MDKDNPALKDAIRAYQQYEAHPVSALVEVLPGRAMSISTSNMVKSAFGHEMIIEGRTDNSLFQSRLTFSPFPVADNISDSRDREEERAIQLTLLAAGKETPKHASIGVPLQKSLANLEYDELDRVTLLNHTASWTTSLARAIGCVDVESLCVARDVDIFVASGYEVVDNPHISDRWLYRNVSGHEVEYVLVRKILSE